MRTSRSLSTVLRLTVLGLATAASFVLALSPASAAAAQATSAGLQEGDYQLSAIVTEPVGDTVTVTVRLEPRSGSLGAIEGSLLFDPSVLRPASCDLPNDFGACNPLDDKLRFSALFLEGISEPTTLATVTFAVVASNTETTIDFAEVNGFDTESDPLAASTAAVSFTTGSAGRNPLVVALPLIALMAVGGLVLLNLRKTKL